VSPLELAASAPRVADALRAHLLARGAPHAYVASLVPLAAVAVPPRRGPARDPPRAGAPRAARRVPRAACCMPARGGPSEPRAPLLASPAAPGAVRTAHVRAPPL
jgi:hypothetical protein